MAPSSSLATGFLLLALTCTSSYAQDLDQMREDLAFLADDAFEGRMTGEYGEKIAAKWIESRLIRMGIAPVNGTYIHPFAASPLRIDSVSSFLSLEQGGDTGGPARDFPHGENFQPHPSSPAKAARGEIVFAGYGISSPEKEYDDLWGLDFEGKVALVLRWEPQAEDKDSRFDGRQMMADARLQAKVAELEKRGAVAVLVTDPPGVTHANIDAAGAPFWPHTSKLYNQLVPLLSAQANTEELQATNFTPKSVADQFFCMLQSHANLFCDIPVAYVSRRILDQAFKEKDFTASDWVRETNSSGSGSGFATDIVADLNITYQPSTRIGWNVAGIIPGSDPKLNDEVLVISAHYDHVGISDAGEIWNGADDNASGTVAALALAESFASAKTPPRRTIFFAFFSGEEIGLLGASKFLSQGIIQPSKIAAMLNLDMIGRALNNTVHVIGTKSSPIMPSIARQAAEGLELHYDTEHEEFFDRSDQAVFYYAGIPVIFFNTDEHLDYHTPNDDWQGIEYESLEQISIMARRAAESLANLSTRPIFSDGYGWLSPVFGRPPHLLVPWPIPFHQRLDY